MSSLLLSATVRRLLLDKIEATIYSWTVSGDSKKSAMHAHDAAFPYLDVTKISIRQPCLNFAVYSSHMLPRRLRRLDVLLVWLWCVLASYLVSISVHGILKFVFTLRSACAVRFIATELFGLDRQSTDTATN